MENWEITEKYSVYRSKSPIMPTSDFTSAYILLYIILTFYYV